MHILRFYFVGRIILTGHWKKTSFARHVIHIFITMLLLLVHVAECCSAVIWKLIFQHKFSAVFNNIFPSVSEHSHPLLFMLLNSIVRIILTGKKDFLHAFPSESTWTENVFLASKLERLWSDYRSQASLVAM